MYIVYDIYRNCKFIDVIVKQQTLYLAGNF